MIETTSNKAPNKKPNNGFLRKSRKHIKPELIHTNKPVSHIIYPQEDLDSDNIIDDTISSSIINKEHSLIAYMRQRSGFNPIKFWKDLDSTLNTQDFLDIQYNGLSLISYAVFFAKDEIYPDLLLKFGTKIPREEFEDTIFTHCLNNNIIFLRNTLSFYQSQYQTNNDFINKIIKKATKTSYRLDNNKELLNWLDDKLNTTQLQLFLDSCIDSRNTVLFETATHYKNLHTYIMHNYVNYKDKIAKLGKTHLIERSFLQPDYYNNLLSTKENNIHIINDIPTRTNLFLQKNESTSTTHPEIIIKKKRKIS